jgi:hypothetical protein
MSYFKDLEIAVINAFDDGYFPDEIAEQFKLSLEDVNTVLNKYLGREAEYETVADPGDMDGDFDSAMASAGFGTDEDYGYYGED